MKKTEYTPEQWIEEHIDLEKLFKEAKGAREGFIVEGESSDYYNYDVPNYEYLMFTLVSGSYGSFITEVICEAFGMEVEKDEDGNYLGTKNEDFDSLIWEHERFAEKVSDILTEKFEEWYRDKYVEDICGAFLFGFLDFDGSYGLFYVEDAGNIEELRESLDEDEVI